MISSACAIVDPGPRRADASPHFPRLAAIHASSSARLPSNIPLRTLPLPQERHQPPQPYQSSWSLPHHGHGYSHPADAPGSSESHDDESDSWTDTADIAEQLAEEDPLRERVSKALGDDDPLAEVLNSNGSSKRKETDGRQPRPGRSRDSSLSSDGSRSSSRRRRSSSVLKEAIRIPDTVPHRRPSCAERLLAAIMMGGRSPIHGLTGKPLLYFTSIFVSLGVFLFGYDQGVMSGVIIGEYFRAYFHEPSALEIATMVAILEVGAFVSSLVVGRIGDVIGRRKTILYGSCVFFVGGAMQSFAVSMAWLMAGRVFAGLGVGMLSTIVPVYQSEISPPHNRGKLACIEFTGNIIGYATSVWVDYFCGFIKSDLSWRLPLLMQCVMGALLGLGSLVIVESPRWLLDHDHDDEGMLVIANLYGGGDIHSPRARDEFRDIKLNVLLHRQEGERTYRDMFRRYGRRVLIAMSAQALAQLNGINVISYYAPYLFERAGWQGQDAILMAGLNGITYVLSTIPPWYMVDRWGRRPILLSGALAMVASLSLIAYVSYLDVPATQQLVVALVVVYNAAFGYSWGPIPWLYPPEILPLKIRSKGASLSTATNWAFNWLVGEMTPILQQWITWRLYLVHAFWCAVSFVVVYFLYPETRGVRLEDMDVLFGDSTHPRGTPGDSASTPALRAESDALLPPATPASPLDGHVGGSGRRGGVRDRFLGSSRSAAASAEGQQGWFSRVLGRKRGGEGYAPVGQED
ncbi:hypothetical protein VTJ83DRAFT_6532 [Remersonia thermophila]|uniref:Major facilitator superfamily (MFS) profile domain-containing protein n=1 Tax=Remersonia thermophila TaxID=72144 RepID=A0ABR4D4Z8_9PEZI